VKITACEKPFTLKLRIPRWACEDGKSYYEVHENVTAGDVFNLEFPFLFKVTRYTGGEEIPHKERYAVEYGPMLFACMGAPNPQTIHFNPHHPEKWFTPVKRITSRGAGLMLKLIGDNCHEYWPYMDIHDEPFDVYPIVE